MELAQQRCILIKFVAQVQSYLASYASAVSSRGAVESVSFGDFCESLNHLPDAYSFLLPPFVGKFPTDDVVVRDPISTDPGPCLMHYDVDSAQFGG